MLKFLWKYPLPLVGVFALLATPVLYLTYNLYMPSWHEIKELVVGEYETGNETEVDTHSIVSPDGTKELVLADGGPGYGWIYIDVMKLDKADADSQENSGELGWSLATIYTDRSLSSLLANDELTVTWEGSSSVSVDFCDGWIKVRNSVSNFTMIITSRDKCSPVDVEGEENA